MKSIFALFDPYQDIKDAVDELIAEGFDEEEMNVIVDEEVAKGDLDVDLQRVDVQATGELGEEATGLHVMLGVEQPVEVPRMGEVLAAGEIATILARTAAAPGEGSADTMEEFGVPRAMIETYIEAVIEGSYLFWIRTSDEEAPQVEDILRVHNGSHLSS
jgi:hypothetical protein